MFSECSTLVAHLAAKWVARLPQAGCCCVALLLWPGPASALMAGSSAGTNPDSPAARVDANVAGSPFAGVASIVVNGGAYSGVVIAPQYVLTAGHVAAAGPAEAMQVVLNVGGTQWTSAVLSSTTYSTYSFPYDDLAVLQLATSVPVGVPVYPMFAGTAATGLTLVLAGYGASGYGDVGVSVGPDSSVRRTGQNTLDALATRIDTQTLESRFFLYDFDGRTGRGPLGAATLGNTVETLVAYGDSGGPAFVRVNGALQVFGINTFATPLSGATAVTYTFGSEGGGIVASDARFTAWLHAATHDTMADANAATSDGPLPPWSALVLGAGLFGMVMLRARG